MWSAILMVVLTACGADKTQDAMVAIENTVLEQEVFANEEITELKAEEGVIVDESSANKIILSNSKIEVSGSGVEVDGKKATISKKGTYLISGSSSDGQIIVDASDEKVILVLDGVSIKSANSSPIYIKSAKDVYLVLKDGTKNYLSDSANYIYDNIEEEEPSATIFSKDDLVISGGGSLEITANFNDAITGKDDVKILNGNISITSVDDGIVGKDSVSIKNGDIKISSKGDGIKSTNDTDLKGNVIITSGTIDISSGDDAIHAENIVAIDSGKIIVQESCEGIEGEKIFINNGEIKINSTDDGLNAVGSATETGNRPGIIDQNVYIGIRGGDIYINASGDGIDSNGNIEMSGGNLIVDGPTNNGNGAIDYEGEFLINGGNLIAGGSAGMALTPSENSKQSFIGVNITVKSGEIVSLKDDSANEIFSYTPNKDWESLVVSSNKLVNGKMYALYVLSKKVQDITISGIKNGNISGGQHGMRGFSGTLPDGNMRIPPDGSMTIPPDKINFRKGERKDTNLVEE